MGKRVSAQNTYAEHADGTDRLEKIKVSDIEGLTFWYGGKGSLKRRPKYAQRCRLANKANNVVAVVNDVTGQELTTVRSSSMIWAAEMAEAPAVESGEVAQDQEREESPATKRAKAGIEAAHVAHERADRKRRAGNAKARRERVITDQEEKAAVVESTTYATPEDAANAERHKESSAPLVIVEIDPQAEESGDAAQAYAEARTTKGVFEAAARKAAARKAAAQAEESGEDQDQDEAQDEAPALLPGPVPPNFLYCLRHSVSENERNYYLRACRRYAKFNG